MYRIYNLMSFQFSKLRLSKSSKLMQDFLCLYMSYPPWNAVFKTLIACHLVIWLCSKSNIRWTKSAVNHYFVKGRKKYNAQDHKQGKVSNWEVTISSSSSHLMSKLVFVSTDKPLSICKTWKISKENPRLTKTNYRLSFNDHEEKDVWKQGVRKEKMLIISIFFSFYSLFNPFLHIYSL